MLSIRILKVAVIRVGGLIVQYNDAYLSPNFEYLF